MFKTGNPIPNIVAATDNRATPTITWAFIDLVNKDDFLNKAQKDELFLYKYALSGLGIAPRY